MSNNAWATLDVLEISRAQADACGIRADVAMNPILLKPSGNREAQLVLHHVRDGHGANPRPEGARRENIIGTYLPAGSSLQGCARNSPRIWVSPSIERIPFRGPRNAAASMMQWHITSSNTST